MTDRSTRSRLVRPEADAGPAAARRRPRIGPYDQRPVIMAAVSTLEPDAAVRALVGDASLEARLRAYEDANAIATAAQGRYRSWGRFALMLMTLATVVSACLLVPIERLWPDSLAWRSWVSGAQSAANLIALAVVAWLKRNGAVGQWMTARAEAERLRGDYFRALLATPASSGGDGGRVLADKLAIVEAAHHDYQRAYFASAIKRHAAQSLGRRWPRLVASIATGVSIAIGVVGVLAAFDMLGGLLSELAKLAVVVLHDPVRWQLGLNTLGSALIAYASAHAMLSQDERNGALYTATLAKLDALRSPERRAAVARAAEAGDEPAVLGYAAEAQTLLEADHQAWMLAAPTAVPILPPSGNVRPVT